MPNLLPGAYDPRKNHRDNGDRHDHSRGSDDERDDKLAADLKKIRAQLSSYRSKLKGQLGKMLKTREKNEVDAMKQYQKMIPLIF